MKTNEAKACWVLSNSHSLNVYDDINGQALIVGFDSENTEEVEIEYEYEMDEEATAFIMHNDRKYYLNECMVIR